MKLTRDNKIKIHLNRNTPMLKGFKGSFVRTYMGLSTLFQRENFTFFPYDSVYICQSCLSVDLPRCSHILWFAFGNAVMSHNAY